MNKFKVGQKVKIIRTGKIGEVVGIGDFEYTKIGQSNACYVVRYSNNKMDWFTVHDLELIKEILDETEKEYLNNVIKPFREKVTSIQKDGNRLREYIKIGIKNDANIGLPYFETDTMYKGMKIYKEYTLTELGLEE